MNLREYQAKKIFSDHNISIPPGKIATNLSEVKHFVSEMDYPLVLKPQLGIKKRAKLGLIKFAENPIKAEQEAKKLFRLTIKNELVSKILIEKKIDIYQEFYLAVTIDFSKRCPVLIISQRGGVDIEETAEKEPHQLLKIPINILDSLTKPDIIEINKSTNGEITDHAEILYKTFRKFDAELGEINPLVQTTNNTFIAVDGVLNLNDDSLFRHPEILEFEKEFADIDPIVKQAKENNWTYIDLPGNIAILSSGAGLTMAILDLINFAGGSAANFIDTAQIDEDGIYSAFELLMKAKSAKIILINIFAGLNRCDSLAKGIKRFLNDHEVNIPIVVRMVGNMEESGHNILSDIGIKPYTKLEDAVDQAVKLSKK